LLDPRLDAVLIRPSLDVSYGGKKGFNQSIELASESLKNVKFIQKRKLVTKFLDEIAQGTGKYCFGIKETIQGLEMGAVESLISWENLDILRLQIRYPHSDIEQVLYLTPEEWKNPKFYRDPDSNAELENVSNEPFVGWIAVKGLKMVIRSIRAWKVWVDSCAIVWILSNAMSQILKTMATTISCEL